MLEMVMRILVSWLLDRLAAWVMDRIFGDPALA